MDDMADSVPVDYLSCLVVLLCSCVWNSFVQLGYRTALECSGRKQTPVS